MLTISSPNHRQAIGGSKTYSQLSALALAQPHNVKLAGQVQAMFRGWGSRGSGQPAIATP
jgi:hypothetical protein